MAGIADEISNRATAVRRIGETPSTLNWVAFLYRDLRALRNAPESFADGSWHFVELHGVVSAHSLVGIHGAGCFYTDCSFRASRSFRSRRLRSPKRRSRPRRRHSRQPLLSQDPTRARVPRQTPPAITAMRLRSSSMAP